MIWAVDLDDSRFTALSGLLGKDVGDNLDLDGIGQIGLVVDDLGSQNGQDCFFEECGEKCTQFTTEIARANDRCDDGEHRKICCPPNNVPSQCSWRGGEDGTICEESCELGELNLFSSVYGDKECTWGKQQFCCTADRYSALVGSCEPGDCGSNDCPSGKKRIEYVRDRNTCRGQSLDDQYRPICCDDDAELDSCRWTICPDRGCLS